MKAVVIQSDQGYLAFLRGLPGVIAQSDTLAGVQENLKSAWDNYREYMNRKDAINFDEPVHAA